MNRILVGDNMTIADLSAYVEIGQLQRQFTNIYDFTNMPNIQRWLKLMQAVDFHDEIHTALTELGDISNEAPTMEVIKDANKKAYKVLQECLSKIIT